MGQVPEKGAAEKTPDPENSESGGCLNNIIMIFPDPFCHQMSQSQKISQILFHPNTAKCLAINSLTADLITHLPVKRDFVVPAFYYGF